jgi:hypothetical protein
MTTLQDTRGLTRRKATALGLHGFILVGALISPATSSAAAPTRLAQAEVQPAAQASGTASSVPVRSASQTPATPAVAPTAAGSAAQDLLDRADFEIRSVRAAEFQAVASIITTCVSALSALLIAWTLKETRSSARAARDSASAASESSRLAAEAFERARRPHLVVSRMDIAAGRLRDPREGSNPVVVHIENFGAVPAFIDAFGGSWHSGPRGGPLGTAGAGGTPPQLIPVIGQGSSGDFTVDSPTLTSKLWDEHDGRSTAIFLTGFVEYRSPTGEGWIRYFVWRYDLHACRMIPDPRNPINFQESKSTHASREDLLRSAWSFYGLTPGPKGADKSKSQ